MKNVSDATTNQPKISKQEYVRGFFTAEVLKVAWINLVCGGLLGVGIGFVPVHTTFMTISKNCTLYASPEACSSVTGTSRHWGLSNMSLVDECLFDDVFDCRTFDHTSADTCATGAAYCTWSYDDHLCQHSAWGFRFRSLVFVDS